MSLSILHLSDIHTGPGELKDEDNKEHVSEATRGGMLDRLTKYIKALPSRPDYVAVTGDLAIQGNPAGLAAFRAWVEARVSEGSLPDFRRIIVVPGNHDVAWFIKEGTGWHRTRYASFFETIGKLFPHAHLPECDPPPAPSKLTLDEDAGVVGGLKTEQKLDKVEVSNSWPFLLDLRRDLLIFAFNSTLGSGVYRKASQKITEPLNALLGFYKDNKDLADKLKQISDGYEESLVIDVGLIGEPQLNYFCELMDVLKQKLGADKYRRLTKIATLHHHVSHLWRQQLEVKSFESVLDAAELKQKLVEHEFDLVLHGHKHTNHVGLDGSVIPLTDRNRFNPLCISSGGTVGGYPRQQDYQSFKLITFDEDTGPRTKGSIREVPLYSDDAADTIKNRSKIYNVPIASKLPELHDLSRLKRSVDDYIAGKCAPELKSQGPGHALYSGAALQIPAASPDIVSGSSRYECHSVLETPEEKVFYDIFLVTKEIGFKQRARIYWFLNDAKNMAAGAGKKCKVTVLIGNLEETHFFQGKARGEVAASVGELETTFSPAIAGGLLEVRAHLFTQDEVEGIIRAAS